MRKYIVVELYLHRRIFDIVLQDLFNLHHLLRITRSIIAYVLWQRREIVAQENGAR
jgi:hypothetical protein